jgi:hypothetical protein
MDRYFFHIDYGETSRDDEGTELPNLGAARNAAVNLVSELLRDDGDTFWVKPDLTVTVADATGLVLWRIETLGSASAATVSHRG